MLMTYKEFFKNHNRNCIYNNYDYQVSSLHSAAKAYERWLKILRELLDKYRNTDHIYTLISEVIDDVTQSYETEAYHLGLIIKEDNYKADVDLLAVIPYKICSLDFATGRMKGIYEFVSYITDNELQIRSK